MKNYLNNNEELSEITSNTYSNINLNYNSASSNNNINHSNSYNDNDLKNNEIEKENIELNEQIENSSDNIESEIETDLKKFAKTFKTKNNNKNMYQNKQEENKKLKIIENYLIKLKNFGYPEMGKIYLSPDIHEQEKTFNFFEYIVKKESSNVNIANKEKFQKKYEELEFQIQTLKQELNKEIKSNSLIQKDLEFKIKKQKDYYDKQFANLNRDNIYLKSVINKTNIEKNNLKQRLENLNETINKFESMKSIIINAFEAIDYVQSNDMSKMLSRVKGAEKLIEALKGGYNESLKELMKEITTLKNFIFDLNNEFCLILDNPYNIDENIYNLSFLDSINLIKEAFKNNMNQLRIKIGYNSKNESINSLGKENCFESLNQFVGSESDSKNELKKI